ncbi:hypothetical protein VKS41_005891 [Umbelopsis sp. WA50703]
MPSLKRLAASHKYDFLTLSGDQAYDLSDFNGTKGDEYMRFAESVFANIPFVGGVVRNWLISIVGYRIRFNNVPFQDSGFNNNMQYSFNYKSLHIVSWNSESDFEGSEGELVTSLNWLETDLQEANKNRKTQPWIIVLGHRPLYCSSFAAPNDTSCTKDTKKLRDGNKDKITGKRINGVEAILDKYKVDMYLCGHRHNFERTYPVKKGQVTSSTYINAPSPFQYLVGNGGSYEKITSFNTTGPFPAWSAARYSGYGYSTIQVTTHHLELTHWGVSNNGTGHRVIDHVVVTKD